MAVIDAIRADIPAVRVEQLVDDGSAELDAGG
jgi:hypothetical protein